MSSLFTLHYKIPQTRHQRGSTQTLKNLSKQDATDWTRFLIHKNADYTIKKQLF